MQVPWQLKASSSVLPPSAPPRAPTLDPAGGLVDLDVSRGEDRQGFSAVEIWVEEAEEYIVLEGDQDLAHESYGSIEKKA